MRAINRTSSSSPEERSPLKYELGEKPAFAFCESVHAASLSPWHIRKTTDTGLHLGGGIDTKSLCDRVKPPYGWDLEARIGDHHLTHCCKACVAVYLKLNPHLVRA